MDGNFWSSLDMPYSGVTRDRSGRAGPERQASTLGALCVILDRQVSSCVCDRALTAASRHRSWTQQGLSESQIDDNYACLGSHTGKGLPISISSYGSTETRRHRAVLERLLNMVLSLQ